MTTNLLKGANALIATEGTIDVELSWREAPSGLDITCFMVNASGKVPSDDFMVFYNQPEGPGSAVALSGHDAQSSRFVVRTGAIGPDIQRCVFTATLDGRGTFADVKALGLKASPPGGAGASYQLEGAAEERALILAELYRHASGWKLRAVGQGFNGGLEPLARHFGVVVEEPAQAAPPKAAPAAAPPAKVSLQKVSLTKATQTHRISLEKTPDAPRQLVVRAQWIDNGDNSSDNDDLDLRAGILAPDGRMHWVACTHMGALDRAPYARHQGDVQSASVAAPGEELIFVNPEVARHFGGPVAMVFSVYSALSNGAVAVASLAPRMTIEYGEQRVECAFDFKSGPTASNPNIYTYVIGVVDFTDDGVSIRPSGLVSDPGSENTPWLTRDPKGGLQETMQGPPVFKGGGSKAKMFAKLLGAGNSRKYVNL